MSSITESVMTICGALFRRKKVDESSYGSSTLARVLNTFDLTALGVGSTLGVGIYVLAGDISKNVAGPAVVVSFLIAAITSAFAGLCFAEFGARVPKAGSAYVYSYYCVGELIAFIIGWSLILEYVIGSASVAKGISTYVDSLLGGCIKNVFMSFAPMEASFMSSYVDFFAFILCIALASALALGVRESTIINNFLTFCNLSVVTFIIISGIFKAHLHYWQLDPSELPGPEAGDGGFAPFGILGIVKGAALCFYGFVGFDAIATTGEEVRNPQKAIPLSILISLLLTFLAYFGVSSVLTLMWPYYLQDPEAPFPYVYSQIGWDAAKWLVAIGALFGMFSSLFGAMFPLPRIIYAMASDGLLFRILGEISPKTKTPVVGTAVAGLVTATMSALFNLEQLISLMALGTLLAYTIVAICVLILRYSPDFDDNYKEIGEATGLVSQCDSSGVKGFFLNYFSCDADLPTALTKKIALTNIFFYSVSSVIISVLIMRLQDSDGVTNTPVLVSLIILGTAMFIMFLSIHSQPKARKCLPFQMPLVPLLPCLSILLNIYLMVVLDTTTWMKLAVWMGAGIMPYICWYYWKYRHGQLGENSRYNVNRVNNVKLNELVWNLVCKKKTFMAGFVNEISTDLNEEPRPKAFVDQIYTFNQNIVEIPEINNNVCTGEISESGLEVLSIAEVHTAPKAPDKEAKTEKNDLDVEPEEKLNIFTMKITDDFECFSPQLSEEKISDQDITKVCIISEVKPEINTAKESVEIVESENSKETVFGPKIPIRKGTVSKIKISSDSFNLNSSYNFFKMNSMNENREESVVEIRGKQSNNDIRLRLSKILEKQAQLIQSGLKETHQTEEPQPKISIQNEIREDRIDVKTLTKSEIKNKLQNLLILGPPKKPSFRKSIFVENLSCGEKKEREHEQEEEEEKEQENGSLK